MYTFLKSQLLVVIASEKVKRKNLSFSFMSACLLCTLTASCLFLLMDKFPCCSYCSTKPSGRRGNKNSSLSTAEKHPCEITAGWKWKCFRAEMYLPFSQTDNSTLLQPPYKSLLCGEAGDSVVLVTSPNWMVKCHQQGTSWNCLGGLVWPDRDLLQTGNLFWREQQGIGGVL